MDQYIGKMLDGRYEILEVIGTGGMAVVYKARCHRLNRLVAVKILKSDLAQDADFRRRFHDESQAVAMLSHPNIVAVYDVSRSSSLEYIVMELIDGITLKQYMQRKGALNWREAHHFITQIMKALSHAHSRGIIHRDIKPHNIMILRDGSVKVADFGIARLISSSQSTLTQEALGSVHYISPEQARGSHIDQRSDIYSAGVVFYEMLTGRLPYEGDSPVSVAIQHINSVPLSPREINPDIQEALEAITLKAMASKVENRYETANAMLVDLEEFRKNPNIHFDYPPIEPLQKDMENEPTMVLPRHSVSRGGSRQKNGRQAPSKRGAAKAAPEKQTSGRVRTREPEEDELPPSRKNSNRLFTMGLAIGAILILIAGLYYVVYVGFISGLLAPSQTYVVPDLVGKTMEEVLANKDEYGLFEIIEGRTVQSETYEAGKIVSQDPAASREVKGNLQITVDISAGLPTINMKDVINMESRTAKLLLDAMGLELDIKYDYANSDSITTGNIISSVPAEDVPLKRGDTVTLTVSTGPEIKPVTMPSLYGMTLQRASDLIVSINLTVGTVNEVDSDEAAGIVVGQSVPSTIETSEGSAIDLQVSNGSQYNNGTDPNVEPYSPNSENPTDVNTVPLQIALPDGTGKVAVVVKQDGATVYDNRVDKSQGYLNLTLTGSGIQYVEVFFDGVLAEGKYVPFST